MFRFLMFEVSVSSVVEGNMLRVIQDLFLAGCFVS